MAQDIQKNIKPGKIGKKATLLLIHYLAGFSTILLSALTITARYNGLYNITDYPFISFLNLGLPFLLAINGFLLLWWIIRLKFWFWFPLITIYICLPCVYSFYRPAFLHTNIPLQKNNTLKVETFNIAGFDSQLTNWSVEALSINFKKDNPDIICMQEFSYSKSYNEDSISRYFKDYPYKAVGVSHGIDLAIFSKYPIERSIFYKFGDPIDGAILSTIRFQNQQINVISCHLHTTSFNQQRNIINQSLKGGIFAKIYTATHLKTVFHKNFVLRDQQARIVNEIIHQQAGHPFIVCGDLNSTPCSYAYNKVKSSLHEAFNINGRGYGNTYKYLHNLFKIDHIFLTPHHFEIADCRVIRDYNYSDHYPMIATLRVN